MLAAGSVSGGGNVRPAGLSPAGISMGGGDYVIMD